MIKRLRIFAGPNGSGKSTLIDILPKKLLGVYVNPDQIEKSMRENDGIIDFQKYNISLNKQKFESFISNSFFEIKVDDFKYVENGIDFQYVNSYIASIISSYIRDELLEFGASFTFETVMSSDDKIDFLKKAQNLGFKTYLYFIATDDPDINISRVQNRVKDGGHDVPEDKIISRYYRTLKNLKKAVKYSDRAFIFDNSSEKRSFICEVEKAKNVEIKVDKVPSWFNKYFIQETI